MKLRSILALVPLVGTLASAQTPVLRQETLGTGVTDIANSRVDLAVRNTYEIDPVNLDGDGDADVVLCNFSLFNPPIGVQTVPPFTAVVGSGGIQTLYNKTAGAGG